MYKLPQEIEVWYVIPAIRRELTSLLTEKYGLSYEKTGDILGITKAAVSQYKKSKRAAKIKLNPKVLSEIEKSARVVSKDKEKTSKEILRILKYMREKGISFEICEEGFDNHEECKEVKTAYGTYWDNP